MNSLPTILTFNDPREKKVLENTEGKGENAGNQHFLLLPAFSPLPTVFSVASKRKIAILSTFNVSSVNALNLVTSKNLSFGKELKQCAIRIFFCYLVASCRFLATLSQTADFGLFQSERVCR